MKHILLIMFLTGALAVPAPAQLDFDNPSKAAFDGMLADASAALPGVEPAMAEDPSAGVCETFSVEGTMDRIPIYDQMIGQGKRGDSAICYAVAAAHMLDHWNLSQGHFGRQELVSPLMLHSAARRANGVRGEDPRAGNELTAELLLGLGRDACTLGVTPGSRRFLSVNEESRMATGNTAAGEAGNPLEDFERAADPARNDGSRCTQAPVQGFKPFHIIPQRGILPNGREGRLPFTLREFRSVFARNNANQPVAVKVSYRQIFGDGGLGEDDNHWALVIARRPQAGRCQYLLRNSMGSDTPLIWVDEVRMQYAARSLAVLTR